MVLALVNEPPSSVEHSPDDDPCMRGHEDRDPRL